MTICLVDTSIFLNVLDIPGRADQRKEVLADLAKLNQVDLLLPFAAIVETGNHIAHLDDGRMRRLYAERFVTQVRKALAGEAPWTVTPMPHPAEITGWLDRFPDAAMQALGLADLAIVAEWEVQCRRWPARRVFIWSLDEHLNSHDREP
jgi:hypothetical protein